MHPCNALPGLALSAIFTLIAGCGGGGGGSGGGDLTDTQTPPPPPPPPDKYEATSYSSAGTSNLSLTGLWMMVEESHVRRVMMPGFGQPGDYSEVKRKRRSPINIVDHGDGTATAYNCVDTYARITTFSTQGSTVQLPIDDALFQATIVNNQRMQGPLVTPTTPGNLVTVLSGSAVLVKIDDQTTLPGSTGLGTASARATENSAILHQFDDEKIYCFTQERYEAESQTLGVFSRSQGSSLELVGLSNLPTTAPIIDGYFNVEIYYETDSNQNDSSLVASQGSYLRYYNDGGSNTQLTSDSVGAIRGESRFTHQQDAAISVTIRFDIEL